MNILFMADVAANPDSGAAGTEYQTICALRKQGHVLEAVWADQLSHKIHHGNLHYLLELPREYEKQLVRRKHESYDVIHVNQPHGYRAARAHQRLKKASVFIHRSHGVEMRVDREQARWQAIYGENKRSFPRRAASRMMSMALSRNSRGIARYADGHIVSTTQCKDFLHDMMQVSRERIAVIPQAAPSLFLESPAPPMTSERAKRILYVGQLAFFKAPMIVAEVITRLAKVNHNLKFTWVCASEHHNEVRTLIAPVGNRVELLDWMPQRELLHVYDRCGLFLFPSFVEGFGKVFLEAMSRGLCVVAADNSGPHDVISHRATGMLVPTGSVEAMIAGCLNIIDSQELGSSISKAAAQSARLYTWERVARETAAFYQDRLAAKASEMQTSSFRNGLLTARS